MVSNIIVHLFSKCVYFYKYSANFVSKHDLNVDKLKDAISREELDIDWINEVIDRIYVYDKDKVEIIWKFTKKNVSNT